MAHEIETIAFANAVPWHGLGVTHWADHVAGRTKAGRLHSAWFGERGGIKRDVEATLIELA